MKRILVVLLALGLAAGTILTQDKQDKKEMPKQETMKEKCESCCCCKKEMKDTKEMKCDMKNMKSDSKAETKKDDKKK